LPGRTAVAQKDVSRIVAARLTRFTNRGSGDDSAHSPRASDAT
jgi:hypothetical protein